MDRFPAERAYRDLRRGPKGEARVSSGIGAATVSPGAKRDAPKGDPKGDARGEPERADGPVDHQLGERVHQGW